MKEPTKESTAGGFADNVLIYDATCRMCVAAKKGFEQLWVDSEANIRTIAYQSDQARHLLGNLYRPGRPDAAYIADPQGNISQGLDAFLLILPGLKGGRCLAALFRLRLAKSIGRFIYLALAKYRYRLFGEIPFEPSDASASKVIQQGPLP
jgi:predicted DCC family thiol-disulfide oxidoreductase YuxK